MRKDEEGGEVRSMQRAGLSWRWPLKDDVLYYFNEDFVAKIKEPVAKNSRGLYDVPEMRNYNYSM